MNRDRMIRGITMLCAAVLLCAVFTDTGEQLPEKIPEEVRKLAESI